MIRFGLSSLTILKPGISVPTWLGRTRPDRRVPIYNFFNRVPDPDSRGYSVRVTHARDFRGGRMTYDGHLGTDFAVPIGTPVVAGAPGLVLRIANDPDCGGLKVCIDHGEGLFSTSNHLSKAWVKVGDRVARGEEIGRSGASGVEFALCFPWLSPHLHYNVWLDGQPVDPFARPGEKSLWRTHNDPVPHSGIHDAAFTPTDWDASGVHAAIDACQHGPTRRALLAIEDRASAAAEVLFWRNYRPERFSSFPRLYRSSHPRREVLDLPLRGFAGVYFKNLEPDR